MLQLPGLGKDPCLRMILAIILKFLSHRNNKDTYLESIFPGFDLGS